MKSYALFTQAASLGNTPDLREGLAAWGSFCDAAEAELAAPTAITDSVGLASMCASGRLRRADYHELLGDAAAAAAERQAATAVVERFGDATSALEVRRTLANAMKYEGRFAEALTELDDIATQLDPAGDLLAHTRVVLDQAMLLEWLGDLDRAEVLLARAEMALGRELDDLAPMEGTLRTLLSAVRDPVGTERRVSLQTMRADVRRTRATVAERSGRLDDSWELWQSAKGDHQALGVDVGVEYNLLKLQSLRGHHQAVLHRFREVDEAMRAHPLAASKLPALHQLAAVSGLSRDPAWSLARVDESMPLAEHHRDYEVLWKLYRTAADALAALGRPIEATARYLDAARTVDQLRRTPLGHRLESTYFADRRPMFDRAIRHAAVHGHGREALELVELAKSRSLTTLVYGDRRDLSTDPRARHIDLLGQAIDAWDLRQGDGLAGDGADRDRLVAARAEAIEQLRHADPRWRSLTEPEAVSADRIADALDGAIALSLFLNPATREVAVIAVEPGGDVSVDLHEISPDAWRELRDYCDNVRRAEDPYGYDLSGYGDVGLADLIGEATCDRLLNHDRAVISPHGLMHLVPWASMDNDGARLFESVGVSIMPNLMCLSAIAGPWPATPTVWLTGAPDYSASSFAAIDVGQEEFSAVSSVWAESGLGGSTVGEDSTETSVRSVLEGDEIELLHLICHGVIDPDEPSSSSLILGDGRVDAAEVALAGSCPDEVVLAACSTGWRPQAVGEVDLVGDDVVGLPAAFLEAGARTMVMSIPEAQDQVSVEFMTRFHRSRADGAAPIDAFRNTQVEMLEVEDPAFWCGYVLYGTPVRATEITAEEPS